MKKFLLAAIFILTAVFSIPTPHAEAVCLVSAGCTGQTIFPEGGFLVGSSDSLRLGASSSPTVGYITATTSTATSTLQKTSISGAVSILGEYFTNFTTYVRSLFTAGTGLSVTSGQFKLADTAVTPGSYTLTNITVDQQGRITAASSGSAGGTVTSVDMSVPTGLSISGNPITTSGTLALTYATGYEGVLTASTTDWNTAYLNRITSLTTSGTSGAATLSGNTLNIPQYQAAGSYLTSYDAFTHPSYGGSATTSLMTFGDGIITGAASSTISATNLHLGSLSDGLLYVSNTKVNSTATSSIELGTITGATWNGNVIGSTYGGAGTINGILKANGSGTVSAAVAGTDYENPLTFGYPLVRTTDAISLAFGTSTSNTWGGTQTFTNSPVFTALSGGLVASNATADTLYNISTSTASVALGLSYSGTLGSLIGGSSGTLSIATSSLYTGATGQIPYFSGSNTITATSSLFIAANGNVGVGTTNPTSLLQLGGNGGSTGSFDVQTNTGSSWFNVGTVGSGIVTFNASGGTTRAGGIDLGARFNIAPVSDSMPTLAVRGYTGGVSDIIRVSSPASTSGDYFIVKSDGKIGIGTTSPSANLSVQGNQYTSGTAFFGGAITATSSIAANSLTLTNALTVPNGGTGATSLTSGYVLVGNGTGAITATSTSNLKTTLALNNVENTALSTWAGSTNLTTLGTITTGTWNGSVIGSSYGGAGAVSGILKANGSGTVSAAVSGTDYAPATSGSSILKGNGSGGFSSAANGTDYTLLTATTCTAGDFVSALTASGGVTCSTPTGGSGIWPFTTSDTNFAVAVQSTTTPEWFKSPVSGSISLMASSSVAFGNAGTDLFFNGTNGYLGIGSTTPFGKLAIQSNGQVGPAFVIGSSTRTDFVVTNGGSVGIGTLTPEDKFQVYDPTGSVTMKFGGTSTMGRGILAYTASTNNLEITAYKSVYGSITLNSDSVAASSATANVGIGTSTPYAKLSVTNTSSAPSFLVEDSASPDTTPFVINASGSVGIGTTTPSALFSVAGGAGFYVDSTGKITGYDTTTTDSGTISPDWHVGFELSTSTAWTATSTGNGGDQAKLGSPYAGSLKRMWCQTNAGTLTVKVTVGASSQYLVASSTGNWNTLASPLTVARGNQISIVGGNPATSPTDVPCTLEGISS